MTMATHDAVIEWTRPEPTSDADFLAGHYSRAHTIGFDHGVSLPGSASPSVVRAPWSITAADPEELLVAATATCHMLWFLDFARRAGLAVRRYRDNPKGVMGKMPDGSIGITRITLRPDATFAKPPSATELSAMHHEAHAACNIANSIRSEVIVEPAEPGST